MKAISVVKYIFIAVGICLLIIALFLFGNSRSFLSHAQPTQGVVEELVRSGSSDSAAYKPRVRFKAADGRDITFVSPFGRNPPSYKRGETVDVLYLPDNPEKARIRSFFALWGVALIIGLIAIVFLAIGGGIAVVGLLARRKAAWLRTHGTPVDTKFTAVELNKSLSVNGRNPFRIISQWQNPATAEIYVFHSENLWFDPSDHITTHTIKVLIAPGNPRKYLVDLSFLPRLAN